MPAVDPVVVEQIRAASRQLVRELGFLQDTLAATDYPPSAVHALLEIDARDAVGASQLADCLQLEKSSVSRMLRKLIAAGELRERASAEDGRAKQLRLSARGRRTVQGIHAFARAQVEAALAPLPAQAQADIGRGLARYAAALQAQRDGAAPPAPEPEATRIVGGYRPGAIGRIAEMHATFYARHAGFGQFFEARVAAGVAEFTARLERPGNGLWLALQAQRIVGAIAIDGEDLGNGEAHLRWFVVDDGLRGSGIGRQLLQQALHFCDAQGFGATRLWTFAGLDAARRLYEAHGFALAQQCAGDQWGATVIEQVFVRPRPVC
ncbi:helix-turn-helix domain-containing GNAT family N-acetyltransferase [Xanthomonas bundabergensis]|uniref:helix-turn-helix domain-containing GNAT family N-acetyltransferase n=1 Tax=Xanthomonas bundabergensis TaxID=3160842 RepID=UPI003518A888